MEGRLDGAMGASGISLDYSGLRRGVEWAARDGMAERLFNVTMRSPFGGAEIEQDGCGRDHRMLSSYQ